MFAVPCSRWFLTLAVTSFLVGLADVNLGPSTIAQAAAATPASSPTPGPVAASDFFSHQPITSLTFSNGLGISATPVILTQPNGKSAFVLSNPGSTSIVSATINTNQGWLILTPISNGKTSITVTGDGGQSLTIPITVAVPVPGPVTASFSGQPITSLTFNIALGSSVSQTIVLKQANSSGTFVLSNAGNTAIVSAAITNAFLGYLGVYPIADGTTSITVKGDGGQTLTIPITVAVPTPTPTRTPTPAPTPTPTPSGPRVYQTANSANWTVPCAAGDPAVWIDTASQPYTYWSTGTWGYGLGPAYPNGGYMCFSIAQSLHYSNGMTTLWASSSSIKCPAPDTVVWVDAALSPVAFWPSGTAGFTATSGAPKGGYICQSGATAAPNNFTNGYLYIWPSTTAAVCGSNDSVAWIDKASNPYTYWPSGAAGFGTAGGSNGGYMCVSAATSLSYGNGPTTHWQSANSPVCASGDPVVWVDTVTGQQAYYPSGSAGYGTAGGAYPNGGYMCQSAAVTQKFVAYVAPTPTPKPTATPAPAICTNALNSWVSAMSPCPAAPGATLTLTPRSAFAMGGFSKLYFTKQSTCGSACLASAPSATLTPPGAVVSATVPAGLCPSSGPWNVGVVFSGNFVLIGQFTPKC
jgi:hypothetical protein